MLEISAGGYPLLHMRVFAIAAAAVSLLVGLVLFMIGEHQNMPWLVSLGGWLTVPATAGFAALLAAVVVGYGLSALITGAVFLLRALRR
jgi:hypothetical protein